MIDPAVWRKIVFLPPPGGFWGSAPPGSDSGLDDGKYSGLGSALVCPLRMIAFRKRRFALLNTGIYLILSGSSDRLMLPGFLPNEFL